MDAALVGGHVVLDEGKAEAEPAVVPRGRIIGLEQGAEDLLENYQAVLDELIRSRPAAAKGKYIRSITLSTTMSPPVPVDPAVTRDLIPESVPTAT